MFCITFERYYGNNHDDTLSKVKKPFHEANAYCQQTWSGATLAIMPNIHYQWFVTSMMAQVIDTPWIGVISEAQDRKVSSLWTIFYGSKNDLSIEN